MAARANLLALPDELLSQILGHLAVYDVIQPTYTVFKDLRSNFNFKLLLTVVRVCRRLCQLAQQLLYSRVHLGYLVRLGQFARTVTGVSPIARKEFVRDFAIQTWEHSLQPEPERTAGHLQVQQVFQSDRLGPTGQLIPVPTFLPLLNGLQSLSLDSTMAPSDAVIEPMLKKLPIKADLFPHLEHCRISCVTEIDAYILLPFWVAPPLKTLSLLGLKLYSDCLSDNHQKFFATMSTSSAKTKPIDRLELRGVGLGFDDKVIAALAGLRAIRTLHANYVLLATPVQRTGWSSFIAAVGPGIEHLICEDEYLGVSAAGNMDGEGFSVFAAKEIPPLGALLRVEVLEIIEEQLDNATGRCPDSIAPRDFLPRSVQRLHVSITPDRMDRLDLYRALNRLLAARRAGDLPHLTEIHLFFRYCYSDLGTDEVEYGYCDTMISAWETEDDPASSADRFEFPGGRTLEHKAFEQDCENLGIRVSTRRDVIYE